ncbi:hypothetical protein ACMG4J_22595 [Rossellomorea marisflavi]|uniref:hypothetical protein n=1 Tax=Rossellomorea marisflavi TaxID=189381 RepID=UPI0039BF825F
MNKNQRIVVDWFLFNDTGFLSSIVELEGCFESVPNEVIEAFEELTEKEQVEVIKKSAHSLLKRMS